MKEEIKVALIVWAYTAMGALTFGHAWHTLSSNNELRGLSAFYCGAGWPAYWPARLGLWIFETAPLEESP
jgi:hypothetical protein